MRNDWKRKAASVVPNSGTVRRPKVSACMIVKNEERALDRCLSSLHGAVDEIIVVDTGSVDRTAEIAKAHGAQVSHFDWVNDFSAARNAALDRATGEWVLSIDADEWLAHDDSRRFVREAVRTNQRVAYAPWTHLTTGMSYFNSARLFRREGNRWEYRVHEQVHFSQPTMGIHDKAFEFMHDGYDPNVIEPGSKNRRNEPMLRAMVEESPVGSRAWKHATIYLARLHTAPFTPADEQEIIKGLEVAAGFDEMSTQVLSLRLYRQWIEAGRFDELNGLNERVLSLGAGSPMVYLVEAVRRFEASDLPGAREAMAQMEAAQDLVSARQAMSGMVENLKRLIGS